ncbi:short-chain fatty acyl-CoA regulator family protein [Sphingomonas sp. BIUV-7]|uniref:Short-chain fatty acyl-CoA regulator family protein n=1 Tax=Sphingomonas natans TaxID=3063330 RepID=A0ABT8Y6P8_9SPHN|nr:short-chain fatty acyl-CoA regulator family protein [Sphingomonas sp. BIUV-7]MDO6413994.1 short-chain fatty acyl-CoA regulator family protein [Sphingomonas sp. BIUV-7]
MAGDRAAYMGPRLRRLRRDLGLTQQGMAADLGVSVSYVSLIESNQRPLTADTLLRLARTYRIDMADFAGDGGEESTARLQAVFKDPLFADLDLPPLQGADVATNYPGIAEAFLRLHAAYREEQRALADRSVSREIAEGDAVAEVRRFLSAKRNNFPTLDDAAERIAAALAGHDGIAAYIVARHGLRVRYLPTAVMMGTVRRHDPHNRAIHIDEALDRDSRAFQLALQIAYLELGPVLDAALEGAVLTTENGRRLGRRALANYAAAAILMPETAFAKAAEDKKYDIEALARQFGTSFEQTAHRLTTLQRPGQAHMPFFFLRVDSAGNVSKRLDGAGFPFAGHGGGCALWSVHDVFRTHGEIVTQWLELPDGQRFFSIARLVTSGGGGHLAPRIQRAIALGCAADDAHRLIYTRGRPAPLAADFTPIGITCALCQRDQCRARAVPPIGRQILPDDYHRRRAPFGFSDETR